MEKTVQCTSAEAAKLLRRLNEELGNVLQMERQSKDFTVSTGEEIESLRPAYDYAATQKRVEELEGKIRCLKHAISAFNLAQEVPGFDMTVDQILVYIPQLSQRKSKLYEMQQRLPKQRERSGYGMRQAVIEYNYANYDIEAAKADYEQVSAELSRAQTALDLINTTEKLSIPADVTEGYEQVSAERFRAQAALNSSDFDDLDDFDDFDDMDDMDE